MGRSGRRKEPREQWFVNLVSELPEVLGLIGGRDQLSWEEGYDRGWAAPHPPPAPPTTRLIRQSDAPTGSKCWLA